MGLFERYLSVWVALAMLLGVVAGNLFPGLFQVVASFEYAQVNLVIAAFIWVMIYPMMVQIDFSAIKDVTKKPKGIVLTLVVNWLIKPFTMALLGWLFFRVLFADWVDPQTATEYIAGMILLGVAPCTAMVFVWSQLTKGDANYTLVQVSVNDIIMIFAFAPISALLLGVSDITVPWSTLILSVLLYVLLPLLAGVWTRKSLLRQKSRKTNDFTGTNKTLVHLWLTGHCSAVIWFSGTNHFESTARHSADCHSVTAANLRHLRFDLLCRLQDCSCRIT